jgi:hypothetical protein
MKNIILYAILTLTLFSGCTQVVTAPLSLASSVAGATISVAGSAVGTGINVAGSAVSAVTPD